LVSTAASKPRACTSASNASFARRAPARGDGVCEEVCRGKASAAVTVDADEVGVAEAADGGGTIRLAARPQIAAGEAAKHRDAAGLRAFSLQREEEFFHGVAHAAIL
jgi:hypothetical protein